MRARRHHEAEHENHDRWLVSYADFITLLFAFFVVMYAISSVNEGKYRVLSDTLDAVFRARERSTSAVNIGAPPRAPLPAPSAEHPGSSTVEPSPGIEMELEELGHAPTGSGREFERQPQVVAQQLQEALAGLVKKGVATVTQGGEWVEVELKSQVLFDSGSAQVKPDATPMLREVAQSVSQFSNGLQVEGYTDDTPISTAAFASNWELSAARAASVVQLFSANSVDPSRMAAVGYGEFRPKVTNDTPEGRQQNRRVVVRISTREDDRPTTASRVSGTGSIKAEAAVPGAQVPAAAGLPATTPQSQSTVEPQHKPLVSPAEVKSITDRPGREGPDS
jgi:chemotaxis protein MotB